MARILVVDDEDQVRSFVSLCLKRAGHEVAAAADGRSGLRHLTHSPVDLVITDIFMPDCDGVEMVKEVRRLHPDLRVLAMSGGSQMVNIDFLPIAAAFGADRTLSKPFAPADLLAAVNELTA